MINFIREIFRKKSDHEKMTIQLLKLSESAMKKRMHILSKTLFELSEEVIKGE